MAAPDHAANAAEQIHIAQYGPKQEVEHAGAEGPSAVFPEAGLHQPEGPCHHRDVDQHGGQERAVSDATRSFESHRDQRQHRHQQRESYRHALTTGDLAPAQLHYQQRHDSEQSRRDHHPHRVLAQMLTQAVEAERHQGASYQQAAVMPVGNRESASLSMRFGDHQEQCADRAHEVDRVRAQLPGDRLEHGPPGQQRDIHAQGSNRILPVRPHDPRQRPGAAGCRRR